MGTVMRAEKYIKHIQIEKWKIEKRNTWQMTHKERKGGKNSTKKKIKSILYNAEK